MTITGAVLLAAIAGALHWKGRVPRFVAWVALFIGVGAASLIAGFLGGFTAISFYGVGIMTILAIVGGIGFFEEAVKRNGMHRIRTPLIAVVTGVALMSASGSAFATLQSAAKSTGTNVNKAVVDTLIVNKK